MRVAFLLLPFGLALTAPASAQFITSSFPVQGIDPFAGMNSFPQSDPGAGIAYEGTQGYRADRDAPPIVHARHLIAAGRYGEANAMLRYTRDTPETRFLKGVAFLGTGDADAARRYFRKAMTRNRFNSEGVQSGLAIAEIWLGNRQAAQDILADLRTQQGKCEGACGRSASIDRAVAVVEKALT